MRSKLIRRALRWTQGGALAFGVGVAGATLAITARHLLATPQPLDSGLPGDGQIDRRHGNEVYYSVAGPADGEPIVLLHDLYIGASNFEYRRLFPRLTTTHRIYAPDWLGWGMSERPAVAYTGEFYAATLRGFLRDVVGKPAVVIARGRAANIALRASADAPELFSRLVMVAPHLASDDTTAPTTRQTLARLTHRLWAGIVPYAMLSARPALRRQAGRYSSAGAVSRETLDHLYASAHQFGGEHAALALFSGELDLPIHNAFALLETPVLLVGGEREPQRQLAALQELAALNPTATLAVIPNAGANIVEEEPFRFAERLTQWMGSALARHPVAAALLERTPDETTTQEHGATIADDQG